MSTPKLKKNLPLVFVVRRQGILLTEDDKLRAYANSPEEQIEKGDVPTVVVLVKE